MGQLCNLRGVVQKEGAIQHAQKFATFTKKTLNDASGITIERATVHFARRSGVTFLARNGILVASIQRRSSNVVWQRVENSWAEAREHTRACLTTCDVVTAALSTADRVEERLKGAEELFEEGEVSEHQERCAKCYGRAMSVGECVCVCVCKKSDAHSHHLLFITENMWWMTDGAPWNPFHDLEFLAHPQLRLFYGWFGGRKRCFDRLSKMQNESDWPEV